MYLLQFGQLELIGIREWLNEEIQSVNTQTGLTLLTLSWLIHLELLDPEKVTQLPQISPQYKNTDKHTQHTHTYRERERRLHCSWFNLNYLIKKVAVFYLYCKHRIRHQILLGICWNVVITDDTQWVCLSKVNVYVIYRLNAFLCYYQKCMHILVAAAQELEPWLLHGALWCIHLSADVFKC